MTLKRAGLLLASLAPRLIPQNGEQFDALADRISVISGIAVTDNFLNVLGSTIMRLDALAAFRPDAFFALAILRMQASESAYLAIEGVRARDKASRDAVAAAPVEKTE